MLVSNAKNCEHLEKNCIGGYVSFFISDKKYRKIIAFLDKFMIFAFLLKK